MSLFTCRCLLPVPLERAFAFHAAPANLARVQPGWAPVSRVEASGPAVPGTRIRVFCGGLLPQTWEVEIVESRPPAPEAEEAWTVDQAVESPFPLWRHQHHFRRRGTETLMTDRIEFRPPLGPIGFLLLPGIHLVFHLMFTSRHRRTRALLQP